MGIPAAAVPSHIALTADDHAAYRRLADALLQTALREYAAFCVDNPARRVSPIDWKLVKSQDSISVYKERHPPTARKDAPPFVPRLLTADGRWERVDANISVPTMLCTGSMRGTVDDAVHGAFIDGPETHATRGHYIHDRSSDFRMLARIDTPSDSDPHRFCGLAWTEMGGAGVPFVKRRDLLTLIASGVVTLPDSDDRIGYYIIHSISHPQLRPLTEHKLLRAKCSFSCLFSQQHLHGVAGGVGSQVETFQKGFFAPLGDVPERGVVAAVMRTLLCPSRLVDAGYNRKLAFLVRHAPASRATGRSKSKSRADSRDDGTVHTSDEYGDSDNDNDDSGCAGGCARRRSDSFFSSSGGSPFSTSVGPLRKLAAKHHPSHGMCVICKLKVCATCKVVKKLVVDAAGYEVVVKSLGFCLMCVNKAKTLSASTLARQELVEQRAASALSSPFAPHHPGTSSVGLENARLSPAPSVGSVRSPPPPASSSVRSPLVEKSRFLRKVSWTSTEASPNQSSTSSDEGYATRLRAATEDLRVERKTSWVGGQVSSNKSSIESDDGSAARVYNQMAVEIPRFERKPSREGTDTVFNKGTLNTNDWFKPRTRAAPMVEQPRLARKTSVPAEVETMLSSKSTFNSDRESARKTRAPPPPLPSRRLQQAHTMVSSIAETTNNVATIGAAETAERKRAPPPQRPRHQSWQASSSTMHFSGRSGLTADPTRIERQASFPIGSIRNQSSGGAATQPRQRIDERVAIEDIAVRGILL